MIVWLLLLLLHVARCFLTSVDMLEGKWRVASSNDVVNCKQPIYVDVECVGAGQYSVGILQKRARPLITQQVQCKGLLNFTLNSSVASFEAVCGSTRTESLVGVSFPPLPPIKCDVDFACLRRVRVCVEDRDTLTIYACGRFYKLSRCELRDSDLQGSDLYSVVVTNIVGWTVVHILDKINHLNY